MINVLTHVLNDTGNFEKVVCNYFLHCLNNSCPKKCEFGLGYVVVGKGVTIEIFCFIIFMFQAIRSCLKDPFLFNTITEQDYKPYFYKLNMDKKTIFQTKGIWEVKNDFMGGPFINYLLKDNKTNEWIIVEGFAFAPSVSKREYMFELNTILSTISINN